ncbi:MAG: hypothetical protein LBE92_09275 [Chryseobacterium sp.]|jgi:hypothetical protein|uniref:hypothetical protein n=1 Tax=Chryseobacterium sp. TaxID=1871047 RepID=UPI002826072F|nr:hypothetical protein [Chryseobacterium sp.]MDR2236303.1 hypothetical protein [Chryseobacterium sp.]
MKNIFLLIIVFYFLSCTSRKLPYHYLSPGVENIKIFPATKKDSLTIQKIDSSITKSMEECMKIKNAMCIDERGIMILDATFPKGMYYFRIALFHTLKFPKHVKKGENRVLVTIGTQNNIESVDVYQYTDLNSKKSIEEAFRSEELNRWGSAKIYGIPVKEQFEIGIFIK